MKPLARAFRALSLSAVLATIAAASGCVWWDSMSVGTRQVEEAPRVSRLWTRQLSRKTRWRMHLPYLYPLRGEFSVPLVTEGGVFVGTSTGVAVGLDLESGKTLWEKEISADPITCRPAKIGETVAFAGLGGEVIGVDTVSGEERWRVNLGAPVAGVIETFETRFLVADAYGGLHALEAGSGELLWRIDGLPPRDMIPRSMNAPVVDEDAGVIYWGRWDGTVSAAGAASGTVRWRENYGGSPPARFTATDQGLALKEGFLYAARFAGPVFKIRTSDGIAVWKNEEVAGAGGPAASSRRVLVPLAGGGLAGLDTGVGGRLVGWGEEIDPDWGVAAQPVEIAPDVFATVTSGASMWGPLSNGQVLLVEPAAGKLLWRSDLLEGSYAGIHAEGDFFAVLSDRAVIQLWRLDQPVE